MFCPANVFIWQPLTAQTSQQAGWLHTRAKSFKFRILPGWSVPPPPPPPPPERLRIFPSSSLLSPLSSLHFHLVICFHSLIYREQESFVGRWIPSDIILWISIRRINSGSVCGIRPHYKLIHQHQPGQYIIHRNFITFVCSGKEKVKEWKSEIRPIFHEELSRRCSEVFFYKHYLQWRMLHPENVIKSQGFIKCFHTYCIHSLGMVPTAFSLLLSGFIRKVWLLSSVCALIPSIQGEWKCPCCLNLQLFPL